MNIFYAYLITATLFALVYSVTVVRKMINRTEYQFYFKNDSGGINRFKLVFTGLVVYLTSLITSTIMFPVVVYRLLTRKKGKK